MKGIDSVYINMVMYLTLKRERKSSSLKHHESVILAKKTSQMLTLTLRMWKITCTLFTPSAMPLQPSIKNSFDEFSFRSSKNFKFGNYSMNASMSFRTKILCKCMDFFDHPGIMRHILALVLAWQRQSSEGRGDFIH